jgi:nucleotide-binding universal stress UspA family protein
MIVSPKRVLWPTDFTELSLHAGRYALGFSELSGAEMHILHVIPPTLIPDVSVIVPIDIPIAISERELVAVTNEMLERLVKTHFESDPKIIRAARTGSPWGATCKYAQENEIDLIVVATHGHTGLRHTLLGGTAERIIQHAPCPVLTVKDPEREFLID